ncbi:MAG: tyrosine-type recombinase/integrase [Gammaproteobacteria bacterium]|nr:tyrosine-type recombinase/integrase [Gammaproteobacteria bacterium]MYF66232.1 tyrosine-type recombinase/integrase [Gammaproteobacteria bacterium]MYK38239.1 tyrosine-type recombinase/integrase [Gammaproteobacteria bacterium]
MPSRRITSKGPPKGPPKAEPSNPPPRPPRLSETFVKSVSQAGQYGDGRGGHGLRLRVRQRSAWRLSKTWAQRLRINGQLVQLGLGTWPIVSLAEAREQALANRRMVMRGRDPRHYAKVPTFAEAAEAVIGLHEPTWKSGAQEARIWRSSLTRYVFPTIGPKPVNEITTADVLAVLTPIWQRETGRRVRQRIAAVMRWSIAQGHRPDNPAGGAVTQVLPRRIGARRNYRSLSYAEVAGAVQVIRDSGAYEVTKKCCEFLVLTAARSGEARLARWKEIDFENATWTVPAERMKAGRPHRVPLSDRTLELLREARAFRDHTGLVFPSERGKKLSNMTLSKLLKDLNIAAVPHGFRASFRTWASEQTDAPRAVMEAALAHRLGDQAEQAYARSDLFEKRRQLMAAWSAYLAKPNPAA